MGKIQNQDLSQFDRGSTGDKQVQDNLFKLSGVVRENFKDVVNAIIIQMNPRHSGHIPTNKFKKFKENTHTSRS